MKKLNFKVLNGGSDEEVKNLFNEFVRALEEENLKDVIKAVGNADIKLLFEKASSIINKENTEEALVGLDAGEKLDREMEKLLCNTFMHAAVANVSTSKKIETFKSLYLSNMIESWKEWRHRELNMYSENVKLGASYKNKGLNGIFESTMNRAVYDLQDCESSLRGSSDEFEDIFKMCRVLNNKEETKNISLAAKKVLFEALYEKMDNYIEDRKNVLLERGTKSYKGKRVITMMKLRGQLDVFKGEVNVTKLTEEDKNVLKKYYANFNFSTVIYSKLSEKELTPAEKNTLNAGLRKMKVSSKKVNAAVDNMRTFGDIVKNDLKGKDKLATCKKIKANASGSHKKLYILDAQGDVKMTYSNITGIPSLDVAIQKRTYADNKRVVDEAIAREKNENSLTV